MPGYIKQKRVLLAMGSRYIDRIHRGVAEYAGQRHWHLTNLFGDDSKLVEQRDCDGIIAALSFDDPLSESIIQSDKPTVDLSIIRQDLAMPHLTGDNMAIGQTAAAHFIERSFRKFLFYAEKNHAAAQLRFEGYRSELEAHGFDCTPMVVEETFGRQMPPWTVLSRWIQSSIQDRGLPCAIYAYNDAQAVNLIDACIAGGLRLPEEVAILGTDNHPLICPTAAVPLSSVNHDLEELGRRAAEELDRLMQGASMEYQIIEILHQGITPRRSSDVFAINDPDVVAALRYIYENFRRSIDVADIVAASTLSRRTLERRFREHFDQSILSKLNQVRLDNARRMLRETGQSISDIAAFSGFRTPEYLHRVFRKTYGMTPRIYRMPAIG